MSSGVSSMELRVLEHPPQAQARASIHEYTTTLPAQSRAPAPPFWVGGAGVRDYYLQVY